MLLAIQEGVKREVLEETGLVMEPTTLLMVECASGTWFRFVITGSVTGIFHCRFEIHIMLGRTIHISGVVGREKDRQNNTTN